MPSNSYSVRFFSRLTLNLTLYNTSERSDMLQLSKMYSVSAVPDGSPGNNMKPLLAPIKDGRGVGAVNGRPAHACTQWDAELLSPESRSVFRLGPEWYL